MSADARKNTCQLMMIKHVSPSFHPSVTEFKGCDFGKGWVKGGRGVYVKALIASSYPSKLCQSLFCLHISCLGFGCNKPQVSNVNC